MIINVIGPHLVIINKTQDAGEGRALFCRLRNIFLIILLQESKTGMNKQAYNINSQSLFNKLFAFIGKPETMFR